MDIGIGTAKQIYDIAKKQGWIDQLRSLFKKRYKVLMLGSSGVGKTNLIQSLTRDMPDVIHYSTRTAGAPASSMEIHSIPFSFIDTPGQEAHESVRMHAIRKHCGSVDLVINVVCYGYHEYARGKTQAITGDGSIDPKYLEMNRTREISAVQEWNGILGGVAPYRLLTVIAKADIWWHLHEEVSFHYEQGEYFKALGAAKSLNPVVTPHSSVFHKLYGVGPLSGHFDEQNRILTRANLLKVIVELIGEGGANV
uniref:Small GTP-binding protein domain-containing protein n=1 Tax=Candidatus Kentrum sp. MB TaxID=2138164 RepID=A0A450Y0Z1_9GAMM|nr:MAG: small GTP-binding protein domain-containing protein [Candidatus Kentron sp. MB]VFK77193.1 MAG: small GTP-binding protein domain-containing protein [Candidatus Kentron sp. MB]